MRWPVVAGALAASLAGLTAALTALHVPPHPAAGPHATAAAAQSPAHQREVDFWAVYGRATDERLNHQWDAAARDYRQALALNPNHWDSLYYLGGVLMELGHYADARDSFMRLANANHSARAHAQLGALYATPAAGSLFDLGRAAREFRLARASNGDESGSLLELGEVALAAGHDKQAQELLADAGRTDFRSVPAHFLLGYVRWKHGDAAGAREAMMQALALRKGQKPPAGAPGEGDTRLPGHASMSESQKGELFTPVMAAFWRAKGVGEERPLYAGVESYIRNLPSRSRFNAN
ncbi:MAG TPA: tetratricopeptide repeat protein [Armatimonadota bacterium]|nr:tetratricopeptide repeat protein [Armatimonadota bacterium]